MFEPTPVILFKNDEACKDVTAIVDKNGLESHKKENPNAWTEWKEENNEIYLNPKDKWEKVPFSSGDYSPMNEGKKKKVNLMMGITGLLPIHIKKNKFKRTYYIDDYILTLQYKDGPVSTKVLVANKDDLQVIWQNGDGYS